MDVKRPGDLKGRKWLSNVVSVRTGAGRARGSDRTVRQAVLSARRRSRLYARRGKGRSTTSTSGRRMTRSSSELKASKARRDGRGDAGAERDPGRHLASEGEKALLQESPCQDKPFLIIQVSRKLGGREGIGANDES